MISVASEKTRPSRYFAPALLLFALAPTALPSVAATDIAIQTPPPPTTQQQKTLLVQMQDAFTTIAQTVEPSVVNIKAERIRGDMVASVPDPSDPGASTDPKAKSGLPLLGPSTPAPRRSLATGSGVIVRADGYILTNDHVVNGATGGIVTVTLADGREFKGKVYSDFRSDLAIVKIDPGKTPLQAAVFAPSIGVRPGQWAIAIGSPFDLENTMTVGVVSAVGRHQQIPGENGDSGRYYPDLIQTDAAINPGNSGGPLFNIDGQVVGINVAIESPVEGSAGVGFAIPGDIAQNVMTALISKGKVTRGFLGLTPDDLTPALQTEFSQPEGAFVRGVVSDSPAGKAGLKASDIIVTFDGKPIHDEVTLRQAISMAQPGKSVDIAYVRDGQRRTTSALIGAAPQQPGDSSTDVKPLAPAAKPKFGISIRPITAHDRSASGFDTGTMGMVITRVAPGSPMETASFTAGMPLVGSVIQKVGKYTVTSQETFDQAVTGLTPGSPVTVVVLSNAGGQVLQQAITVRL